MSSSRPPVNEKHRHLCQLPASDTCRVASGARGRQRLEILFVYMGASPALVGSAGSVRAGEGVLSCACELACCTSGRGRTCSECMSRSVPIPNVSGFTLSTHGCLAPLCSVSISFCSRVCWYSVTLEHGLCNGVAAFDRAAMPSQAPPRLPQLPNLPYVRGLSQRKGRACRCARSPVCCSRWPKELLQDCWRWCQWLSARWSRRKPSSTVMGPVLAHLKMSFHRP